MLATDKAASGSEQKHFLSLNSLDIVIVAYELMSMSTLVLALGVSGHKSIFHWSVWSKNSLIKIFLRIFMHNYAL